VGKIELKPINRRKKQRRFALPAVFELELVRTDAQVITQEYPQKPSPHDKPLPIPLTTKSGGPPQFILREHSVEGISIRRLLIKFSAPDMDLIGRQFQLVAFGRRLPGSACRWRQERGHQARFF
jgi:hypothetical protein